MINEYKNKINKIDKLLKDNNYFNDYIEDIENKQIDVPLNIEYNLKQKITNENPNNKYKFYDILKIAACTILALMLWQITFPSFVSYANVSDKDCNNREIYNEIDSTMIKFSEFFNNPINFERGDK